MSNKQQFLNFLTETSDVVFHKFHTAFGYDDWCDALIDFPEAGAVYINKQQLVSEITDWESGRCHETKRQQILDAFTVFLRENEGRKEENFIRTELGYKLAQKPNSKY